MQLISIQQWCELGQIIICTKVSMLSLFSAMPHEGHLEKAVDVFSYLTSKSNLMLVFDLKELDMQKYDFVECDWLTSMWVNLRQFYTMPQSLLEWGVILHMFMDSNHAGDKVNQHLRTDLSSSLTLDDWLAFKEAVNSWDLSVWQQILHHENMTLRIYVGYATSSIWWASP